MTETHGPDKDFTDGGADQDGRARRHGGRARGRGGGAAAWLMGGTEGQQRHSFDNAQCL